jgi:hypothetical protein
MTIRMEKFYVVIQDDPRCGGKGMKLACSIVKFCCPPECKWHYAKWSGIEDMLEILPGGNMYLADSWEGAIEKIGFDIKQCPAPE